MAPTKKWKKENALTDELHKKFGKISQPDQIAAASQYCRSVNYSKEHRWENDAWARYFFVHGQILDDLMLDELACSLECWVALKAGGALEPFLKQPEVEAVAKRGGCVAEVFRAYLDVYKTKAGISEWNIEHFYEMKCKLYEADDNFREIRAKRSSFEFPLPEPLSHPRRSRISDSQYNNANNTPSSSLRPNSGASSPPVSSNGYISRYGNLYDDEGDQEDEFEREYVIVHSGPVTPVAEASQEVATMIATQIPPMVPAKRKRLHDNNHEVSENSVNDAAVNVPEVSIHNNVSGDLSPRSPGLAQTIPANSSSPKTGKTLVGQILDRTNQLISELKASEKAREEKKKVLETANQELDTENVAIKRMKQEIINEAKQILHDDLAHVEEYTSTEIRKLARGLEGFGAKGARNLFCLADAIDGKELAKGQVEGAEVQYRKSLETIEAHHKKLFG